MSSGLAAWPEAETTYFFCSLPWVSAVDEGGRVDGRGL